MLSRLSPIEKMHSGVTIKMGKDAEAGTGVERTIEFEQIIIDQESVPAGRIKAHPTLHQMQLQGTAKRQAPTSRTQQRMLDPFWNPADKVAVTGESYTVASTTDNRAHAPGATFASQAMAADYMARQVSLQPNLASALHVIPAAEVNRSAA